LSVTIKHNNKTGNVRTYNVTLRGDRLIRCYSGKSVNITYSECVPVVLNIQHAMRMLRIILPSVTCLAVQYFSTLSQKRPIFGKH